MKMNEDGTFYTITMRMIDEPSSRKSNQKKCLIRDETDETKTWQIERLTSNKLHKRFRADINVGRWEEGKRENRSISIEPFWSNSNNANY